MSPHFYIVKKHPDLNEFMIAQSVSEWVKARHARFNSWQGCSSLCCHV